MSKFQIILLGVFALFIVVAVFIFSFARGSGSKNATVMVWGSISSYDFNQVLGNAGIDDEEGLTIRYEEKSLESIESDFTEALATGVGPDLIVLPLEKLWKNRNKLVVIPYKSISERDFQNTFVEEGELLLGAEGVYALPLTLDPMVLYYNRDHLSRAGMAKPLAFWDEIYTASLKLTERDGAGNITKSVMALGEARNIPHAKSVLSLLLLQAGTPITSLTSQGLTSALRDSFNLPTTPGESALDFYTQFSNPAKPYYSWNRSLLSADTHFISGDTAYYLGFASELRILKGKNPTLNLGVASVPQSRVAGRSTTYGKMQVVAVSRATKNTTASLSAILKLISAKTAYEFSKQLLLPPPRRDLLSQKSEDAVLSVFYDSALQARGWLDPEDTASALIFREMIESITSGRARTSEAISQADKELEALTK